MKKSQFLTSKHNYTRPQFISNNRDRNLKYSQIGDSRERSFRHHQLQLQLAEVFYRRQLQFLAVDRTESSEVLKINHWTQ